MEKDSLKENSFKIIEPDIYVNAVHYFIMKRLHIVGSWLMLKTLPYVEMYEFDIDDDEEEL